MSDKNSNSTSRFVQLTNYLDCHIRALQYSTYGIGCIGLALIFRSLRLAAKFQSIAAIPPEFLQKHFWLRGIVTAVQVKGETAFLHISHLPIINVRRSVSAVPVQLSGINLKTGGWSTLQQLAVNQRVWFQLMSLDIDVLDCIVYRRTSWFWWQRQNFALQLVLQGQAIVAPLKSCYFNDEVYLAYYKELLNCEKLAEKNKKGVWKSDEIVE